MWEAIVELVKLWQITPFAASGWAVAILFWWRDSQRSRELAAWMREDAAAKGEIATAQQSMRDALHSIHTELAVMRGQARS